MPHSTDAGDGIGVVIVEDDTRYRQSLETLFGWAPSFSLAESFASADAAIARLERARNQGLRPGWNLVLMDLALPGTDGIEATRRIKRLLPDTRVVVLTVFEESRTVLEAVCAGADGYLVKRTPPRELVDELRSIMSGGAPISGGVARTVLELVRRLADRAGVDGGAAAPSRLDLTDRERDVLRCLVKGMGYDKTASALGISPHTVRAHIRSVYSKLQVHSIAQAVSRALQDRLV